MKGNGHRRLWMGFLFLLGPMTLALFLSDHVFAAEEMTMTMGRRIWNNIMLWVNFGILVFLFLKFGKKPLMDYLRGVRDKIGEEIATLKGRYNAARSKTEKEREKLRDIERQLDELQKGIIELGNREKQEIIEQGRVSAEKMIKDAENYSRHKLSLARQALSQEMMNIAVSMVSEKLINELSDDDDDKLIDQFISDLETRREIF